VAAVVAGEYPFEQIEGVKAQAVLARTYALHRHGRLGDHDVVDSVMDQVYPGATAATDLTRRAADETRGEVLSFGGDLAEIYYSSSNGGHTAASETVWGRPPVPYLQARPDPYDESPDSRWTARIPARRLHDALSRRFGGRVTAIEIDDRSSDGRVHWIRLRGARRDRVLGQDFRMLTIDAFGGRVVRSTLFDLSRSGDDYVFEGRGWGHGVGMSQYGARAQAREGRSYRDILAFYFDGAELTGSMGDAPLIDYTPMDPEERAAMGLRSRPLTRAERAAREAVEADQSTGARIERVLRDSEGRILPEEPEETDEADHGPRRTSW
jgi:stage II sporulation protein D